jgi:hypothetical protein
VFKVSESGCKVRGSLATTPDGEPPSLGLLDRREFLDNGTLRVTRLGCGVKGKGFWYYTGVRGIKFKGLHRVQG